MAREVELAGGESSAVRDPSWPDATIVLLTHQPGDWEVETAELIRGQRYRSRVELVVIDSSRDHEAPHSRALRTAADRWEALRPEAFGHARTRNLGLDLVTTPVAVFLSSDAHPANDRWLENLVEPLASGRAEASYGRQVTPRRNAERETTYGYLYPEAPEIKSKDRIRELGIRTFHFSDVTSAFLTDVLRSVRFPDELAIFEDVGVAKRLLDDGYRIAYVPEAAVLHVHELGVRELVKRYRRIGAVYEHLGIFAELRRAGTMSYLRDGLRTTRAVTPSTGGGGLRSIRSLFLGGLKLGAVTYGRIQTRLDMGDVR